MVSYFTFRIIVSLQVKSVAGTNCWGPPEVLILEVWGVPHKSAFVSSAKVLLRLLLTQGWHFENLNLFPAIQFYFFLRLCEARRQGWLYWHWKVEFPFDPAIPFLGLYSTEKNYCTSTITVFLVKVKNWKQPKCPSVRTI